MDEQIVIELEQHKSELHQSYVMATKIVYYLLDKGELSIDDHKEFYLAYSDKLIQQAVDEIAESFKVLIRRYNHVIYLMPNEDNEVIGMKMQDLRNIAGSVNTNITAYLSMYIMTLFLQLFYNGVGESLKTRDYVSIREIVDLISDRLEKASMKERILDEEEDTGYNVIAIKEHWSALQEDDEFHRSRNSKFGYVRSVVKFLENQKLFIQYSHDNIRPTAKLTALMGHQFLDQNRKEKIEQLFSENSVLLEE
jgi:hypothetical protein